jgi:hypothetical protein
MPEVNNYSVTLKELAGLIVKASGVHEGRWFLAINFGMGPGNFGPTPEQLLPGMVLAVQGVFIQREDPANPLPGITVDAGEINPEPAPAPKRRPKESS